jgi:6-phosphogluconolactonase
MAVFKGNDEIIVFLIRASPCSSLLAMSIPRFYESAAYLLRAMLLLGCLAAPQVQSQTSWVYFGTYTGKSSRGIYVSRFDSKTGVLGPAELAVETKDPSYLALHPGGKFLYAVNEVSEFKGKPGGGVSSFQIDPKTGLLTSLNSESSRGGAPCHLIVDKAGRHVLVANYTGGSVGVLPIAADGSLKPMVSFVQHTGKGTNPARQEAPHAHAIYLDAANRYALVSDLGLDKVLIYRFDAQTGILSLNDATLAEFNPGAGPRHFAFLPRERAGYSLNEIQSTITTLSYDRRRGQLSALQTVSTLPPDFTGGNGTAEIFVHPSGKFVYASNRGHDSLAVFKVTDSQGRLSPVQHMPIGGRTPRGFGIDPTGRWILVGNQSSDQVTVFRIDSRTGKLTAAGAPVPVGSPVSVHFLKMK